MQRHILVSFIRAKTRFTSFKFNFAYGNTCLRSTCSLLLKIKMSGTDKEVYILRRFIMKKETKSKKIDARVTPSERERIEAYAKAHDLTIGELIRQALTRMMAGK